MSVDEIMWCITMADGCLERIAQDAKMSFGEVQPSDELYAEYADYVMSEIRDCLDDMADLRDISTDVMN